MSTQVQNLYQILEQAASTSGEITCYSPGNFLKTSVIKSYKDLLQDAQGKANLLSTIPNLKPESILLIHFDNHFENMQWFWAAIISGNVPALSVPFVNDVEQRRKHLLHLKKLLKAPIILTTQALVPEFLAIEGLHIHPVEKLAKSEAKSTPAKHSGPAKKAEETAVLMLTSGSTGNAKAVALHHGQIIAAALGKSEFHGTTAKDHFLNWIGLDHVSCLVEVHLLPMLLGAHQIHVSANDLLVDPLLFLQVLHKHRIAFTFAPNFFLGRLRRAIESAEDEQTELDLSPLRVITSGGEANVVETAVQVTKLLQGMGAREEFIRPGFGMTETCAGAIFNKRCPSYDVEQNLEFTSLGQCMPGIEMRIVTDEGQACPESETGNLQICGPVVFKEYFNNPTATADAFTSDQWFSTGDLAFLDAHGSLHLRGRTNDSIIINGVKYSPHELETAIEEANIPGLKPTFTVVFSHRAKGSETEGFCVVYLPTYGEEEVEALVHTADAISKVCSLICGTRPLQTIPLPEEYFSRSTLGKISRAKTRASFEKGDYDEVLSRANKSIKEYREARFEPPKSELERLIRDICVEMFELPEDEVGADLSLFDLGISSVDLIAFKLNLERKLKVKKEISMVSVLSNPSIRGIARALEKAADGQSYDPVVPLQPAGTKSPLWLVHPGTGDILVFLPLAKQLTDRPVYALRARGLDEGQAYFESVDEAVKIYHSHLKETQPDGPYLIVGYSLGALIAFELGKMLEANGDSVAFLGSFDFPPHIRNLQHEWPDTLLNLCYFLDFITEEHANEILPEVRKLSKDEAVEHVVSIASAERLAQLSMTAEKLKALTEISFHHFSIVREKELGGKVAVMDVFQADPIQAVAKTREEWLDDWLSKWSEFVGSEVRVHQVEGGHHTMIDPEHIASFVKVLKKALSDRNL